MILTGIKYSELFCEENIWHLCQHAELVEFPKYVLFISNARKQCPFWFQKSAPAQGFVCWDYHVVLAVKMVDWKIFDLDTTLSFPIGLKEYVSFTFKGMAGIHPGYFPSFKIIDARRYVREFYSDRKHMKDEMGEWLSPAPDWSLILGNKMLSIDGLFDFTGSSKQEIYSLPDMLYYLYKEI
ncbi:protein N-terminal glutamine amidohydrolase [Desulforhopalus sp. 52FAK]